MCVWVGGGGGITRQQKHEGSGTEPVTQGEERVGVGGLEWGRYSVAGTTGTGGERREWDRVGGVGWDGG